MQATFEVISQLRVTSKPDNSGSTHHGASYALKFSPNLDKKAYVDENQNPTKEGCKVATETLVASLIANIHYAHNNRFRDSAEHLRHIINQLEKGFISIGEVIEGELDETH